jgi:hypothetical protein
MTQDPRLPETTKADLLFKEALAAWKTKATGNCSCAGRSFWEGLCDWCHAFPRPCPLLNWDDYNRAVRIQVDECIDKILDRASIELGWSAACYINGFRPDNRFEGGLGI